MTDQPTWESTAPIDEGAASAPSIATPAQTPASIPLESQAPRWEDTTEVGEISPGQKLLGGAEAIARGVLSRPVVAAIQTAAGVTPQESDIREQGLGEGLSKGLEFGAMVLPAVLTLGASAAERLGLEAVAVGAAKVAQAATLGDFTQAALLSKAGAKAVAGLGVKGAIARGAVQMGTEAALFAGEDEVAKMIKGQPEAPLQAIYNVGMSGVLGAVTGGAVGKAADLWTTKYGPVVKEFVKDFSKRTSDINKGAVPMVDAVVPEVENLLTSANEASYGLSGKEGLKRQEIESLLPKEKTPEIIKVGDSLLEATDKYLKKVKAEPEIYGGVKVGQIDAFANRLAGALSNLEATPYEIHTAIDNFKKGVASTVKWRIDTPPESQKLIRELEQTVRSTLEDSSIWGVAGQRQKEINKVVSNYIKDAENFEKIITTKVGNDRVVNPDKIQTIINQAAKGKGALKQNILSDFLDSTDELYNAIQKIDAKFGVNSGFERPTMTASRALTEKLTPGMKWADYIHGQAVNAASEAVGGGLGYKAGRATGVPGGEWLGAAFGHYAIKPVLKTIMPVLIKPVLATAASGPGIRAASQAITAIADGSILSKAAADAVFLSDKPMPSKIYSSPKKLDKLDKKIQDFQRNPQSMLDLNQDLMHYLPNHAETLTAATANVLNYCAMKKPQEKKNGPLDRPIPPNPAQMAAYNRTLGIAENPLTVYEKIKNGTLHSQDVIDCKSMYPDLYKDMVFKLSSALVDHLNKGTTIPYPVKKGLSLFTVTPIDSNFKPQAIQAAQATYQPQQQPQSALPQMAKKSSRKSQLPSLTETDQQRRMLKR
jgi:hypothetical protein